MSLKFTLPKQFLYHLSAMLTVFVLSFSTFVSAQKERNTWYFGYNCGIDFNSSTHTPLTNGALWTSEGCTSISDYNGNFLFSTNGENVWNSNQQIMPNGSGLLGHWSASQSAITFKVPGESSRYYIFTTSQNSSDGLNYYIVDMTLDGGLGDVIVPSNNQLLTPTCERLTYCKHANGIDYWVIAHELGTNKFHVFLVNSSGVSLTSVTSPSGSIYQDTGSAFWKIGCMKVSTDGSKIATAITWEDKVEVFDFNNITGVLNNPIILTGFTSDMPYGVEFSPNSQFLYVSENATHNWDSIASKLYQYDMLAGSTINIVNSRVELVTLNGPTIGSNVGGSLQIAPDGKIYHAVVGRQHLGVINSPNIGGISCDYVEDGFYLDTVIGRFGLPNYTNEYETVGNVSNDDFLVKKLLVYPNPTRGNFSVDLGNVHDNVEVSISDITGKIIQTENYFSTHLLNLSINGPAGIYLLTVVSDDKKAIIRFFKE